jgi:hypothetical protein
MDPITLDLITKGGTIAVCVFVIWLGWKREERAAKTFDVLNTNSQALQQKTIEQMTALNENTRALHNEIRGRPCIQEVPYNGNERRHKV